VPPEIEPPALARLVDFAERPRTQDWSLRSALVRYAQPQPQRVDDLLDLVRRVEWALGRQTALLRRDGEGLWSALERDAAPSDEDHASAFEILRVAQDLDRLGDVLADWAVDITHPRPDAEVDATIATVGRRLEELGIPREERPPQRQRG
jgi:hypothetical protein